MELEDTAGIYHAWADPNAFAKNLARSGRRGQNTASMLEPELERRVSRTENTLVALTRLLEAARRSAELEAVAIGDDAGLLVAGAGAAELCAELAAVAPLSTLLANDTVATRWDVLCRRTEVRRLRLDGLEVLISGRGGDLGLGLGRVAAGCARILGKRPDSAR